MEKNIIIAAMFVVAGLAMTAGAAELSGVKAADVAALSEAGGIPRVSEPAMAENHRKATVCGTTRDRSMQALMKELSVVLASGPLPGGCSLEVNAFRASAFQPGTGDNLNVGIMKDGEYTDILMVGVAQAAASSDGRKYTYESVSCPSDNWVGRCEKNSFTLATDAGGRITAVFIERAKEKSGMLGDGWKVTSSVVCR
jgi:hypothetical protein